MSEKSGLDLLQDILNELKLLHKKVDLLDKNIKLIANSAKISELAEKVLNTNLDSFARTAPKKGKMNIKSSKEIKKSSIVAPEIRAALKEKNKKILVTGKMVANINNKPVGLGKVNVKIFDTKDNLVKETNTSNNGTWMCQLDPGKYVALFEGEYKGKKLVPVNKVIIVPEELPYGQDALKI